MDKKLILYSVILAGLAFATFQTARSNKESEEGLTEAQEELLLDTGYFEISDATGQLAPLYEPEGEPSLSELADGGTASAELKAAFEKFNGGGQKGNTFLAFALFVITGIFAGFVVVTQILPMFVQKASEEVYGSTEQIKTEKARITGQALVAQGDWEGAIEAYREEAEMEPENRLPWVEMAMIKREKLEDSDGALAVMDEALARGGWRDNDEAVFLFRKVEIYEEDKNDHASAVALLREVIEKFPQTRHSANAMHKLHQMGEQA